MNLISDEVKRKEFLDYLEENVWQDAERFGKDTENLSLVRGIRLTRVRMTQLPTAEKMLHFFWSAVQGTDKSINFSDLMKSNGITRFEDVLEEVRVKFNDEWLRA